MSNLKGNGGKPGGPIQLPYVGKGGCLFHACADCLKCPLGDCDYNPVRESRLRQGVKRGRQFNREAYQKQYNKTNRKGINERQRRYYYTHLEQRREYQRQYREANYKKAGVQ